MLVTKGGRLEIRFSPEVGKPRAIVEQIFGMPMERGVGDHSTVVLGLAVETLEALLGVPLYVEVDQSRRILYLMAQPPAKLAPEFLELMEKDGKPVPCPGCQLRDAEKTAAERCTCSSKLDDSGYSTTVCEPHKKLALLRAQHEGIPSGVAYGDEDMGGDHHA